LVTAPIGAETAAGPGLPRHSACRRKHRHGVLVGADRRMTDQAHGAVQRGGVSSHRRRLPVLEPTVVSEHQQGPVAFLTTVVFDETPYGAESRLRGPESHGLVPDCAR